VVCDAETGRTEPVASDVKLASLQTVGVRNDSASVNGFDYLVIGDALPLDKSIDVSDSVNKLVPYEAVATKRSSGSNSLLVSIAGVDGPRSNLPETVAAMPAKHLHILVVSGAPELAISGLDLIDARLNATGGDRIGLDIEWQLIDQTGLVKPAGQYASFDALVKAAADKGGERPDVLNEGQLLTLLGVFEGLLRTRTVDKIFWIKGAYAIPSSIPQPLERFLASVSSSNAVPHTPGGQPGKWLQIVTARMPGFSIAYLKEPVNSLQIGDVLEEGAGSVTGPRRLISVDDANVLASKLRAGLTLLSAATKPTGDVSGDRGGVSGKLVLDAGEVFDERGYVISTDSALALQVHLQNVLNLWDPRGVMSPDVLADFATKSGRPQPTIVDVLQMGDSKEYPRLPRTLPDWSRKPLKGLNQDETDKARALVKKYADLATGLADKTRRPAASPASQCSLFYISEGRLGFE
jgi:hypothetical protein